MIKKGGEGLGEGGWAWREKETLTLGGTLSASLLLGCWFDHVAVVVAAKKKLISWVGSNLLR